MAGSLLIRLFAISLDFHLHLWDEQFHAMVAKNLLDNPLKPFLYKHNFVPRELAFWDLGHIWLHKQPLFMWQMAVSMKYFGVNAFAIRLPSAILGTIGVFFIYRTGRLWLGKNIGFLSGLLLATSFFTVEMMTGIIHTDHNDSIFQFYILASIWAWSELEHSQNKKRGFWIVLVGILAGCAVLNKWLTGLLVYLGWGLTILFNREKRVQPKYYLELAISVVICLITFLPWQLYIWSEFPKVARFEFEYNSRHLFENIEGHGGDVWYHFNAAKKIYGIHPLILFPLIMGFWFFKEVPRTFKIATISYFVSIYLLFTVAKTKMIAFTFSISTITYIFLAFWIFHLFRRLKSRLKLFDSGKYLLAGKWLFVMLILSLAHFNLKAPQIIENHTSEKAEGGTFQNLREYNARYFQRISEINKKETYVLFNTSKYDEIPAMFFGNFASAYNFKPSKELVQKVKSAGFNVAILDSGDLPFWIQSDSEILKISGYRWIP
ncbi:ArnT family glycosyltransferase [Luteibaculum oceani]|uniref:ArnT family glycosyltransferase n=1 Tax=Luteibaculum oceani TaxID=1294296 RepID=UPI001476CBE1|nr:glycosyltransferase family 39 protein [Luteibaculum oceani]